jgi:thiamine pyrophosphokinase
MEEFFMPTQAREIIRDGKIPNFIIIANGWLNDPVDLPVTDILIAADGGARHCIQRDWRPDYVIGDMDSLEEVELKKLENLGVKIIRHPPQKDQTDLELAVSLAIQISAEQGLSSTSIAIYAALGARWDQTLANVLLPAAYHHIHIRLVDGLQEIHMISSGQELHINGQIGEIVSLIALSMKASGIKTTNLEYRLQNEPLTLGSTRGVSNVMISNQASVYLKKGLLLCTHTRAR